VILLDANILIYSYNRQAPQSLVIQNWLEQLLEGHETVALTWPVLWAFVRVITNSRVWDTPTTAADALGVVREWMAHPNVVLVEPGRRHLEILQEIIIQNGASGPLVSDAVLAAIAIEHGATLASTDQDFSRFENLRWINPLR